MIRIHNCVHCETLPEKRKESKMNYSRSFRVPIIFPFAKIVLPREVHSVQKMARVKMLPWYDNAWFSQLYKYTSVVFRKLFTTFTLSASTTICKLFSSKCRGYAAYKWGTRDALLIIFACMIDSGSLAINICRNEKVYLQKRLFFGSLII